MIIQVHASNNHPKASHSSSKPSPKSLPQHHHTPDAIDVGVCVMHAVNALLRFDNQRDSVCRRLRIHSKLAARKLDKTMGREAAAVIATCLAISHLSEKFGVFIDVKTLKPVLSSQTQTVVDLVHGKGDVDLSPLLITVLSRLGEPAARQLLQSLRARLGLEKAPKDAE
jgi:hypothetical protein